MTELNGIVLSRLPVLPLRGLTAFPNMIVHFDVGRMMSIRALEAAMKNGQTIFLTAQRELKTDTPTPSDLYQIGTICQIRQILRLPGDNIRVLVEGKTRALAHNFIAAEKDEDCMYAEVEELEDYVYGVTERRAQALVRTAQERFGEYAQYASRLSPDVELTVAEGGDPGYLADYIAQNIPVDVAAKQEILEELGITRRLVMVIRMLGEETEVLKIENEIQDELKTQIDKNQKEYYLREQIKVIQTELGEQDVAAEAESYRTRVLDLKLPKECEDKLIREVDRFAKLSGSTAEQGVVRTYLDTVLDLPWNKKSEERHDLAEAQAILDRDHYGMEKVKERIMEFLAVKSLAPDLKGQVLCLVGPPGVGKTSIAKSVAEAMGRSYTRMSLGGVRDEADIRGHRKTYIGAMPGRIMDALRRAGTSNPLILLDEIDKMGNDFRGDPASAMLEVLDTEQNVAFRDHYIELPFDLSDVVFLTTANDLSTVPRPLLDRMEVIELPSYTAEEKRLIARRHLLSKQMKKHGLSENQLIVDDETLDAIISGYTREAGVRRLEQVLAKLCRKAAKHIADGDESLTATKENLEELLGTATFKDDLVSKKDEVGIVNGLAWTSVGGEMLEVRQDRNHRQPRHGHAGERKGGCDVRALQGRGIEHRPDVLQGQRSAHSLPGGSDSEGRPVRRRDDHHGADFGADWRAGSSRGCHDRRGNAARPRAADRRSARENHGGVPCGHQDRVHSEGQRERFEGHRAGRSGKHQLCHCGAHGHGGGDRDRLFAPSQAEKTQVRTGKACSGLGIDNGGTIIWK